MQGTRLPDSPIGQLPMPLDDIPNGGYWKVLTRDSSRPLNVKEHQEDRRWWGDDSRHDQNLTGGVWGVITPDGRYGMLSIHTVREHEDGTISVLPGDGSSNSILVSGGPEGGQWHGYIYAGVWREC